jgi:hypothetical protein
MFSGIFIFVCSVQKQKNKKEHAYKKQNHLFFFSPQPFTLKKQHLNNDCSRNNQLNIIHYE